MRGKLSFLVLSVCAMPLLAAGCSKAPEVTNVPPASVVRQGHVPQRIIDAAVRSFTNPIMSGDVTGSAALERDFENYFFESIEETTQTEPRVSAKESRAQLSAKYPRGKVYEVLVSGHSPALSTVNGAWSRPVLVVDTGVSGRVEVIRSVP